MDRGEFFFGSKPDLSFGEAIFLKTNRPHTFSISFWAPRKCHVFFKTQFLEFTKLLQREKTQLFHTEPSYVIVFFFVVVRPFQNFGTPQLGQYWLKPENSTTNAPCCIQGYPNGPSCVLKHLIYRKAVHRKFVWTSPLICALNPMCFLFVCCPVLSKLWDTTTWPILTQTRKFNRQCPAWHSRIS